MNNDHDLLLTFYGDDFTGSTTVMEVLSWGGVPTVLITDPGYLERARELFPEARAIGLAGVSRSMSRDGMSAVLPELFSALAAMGAPLFHYKICSTFDSAPDLGSIGHAIELGLEHFKGPVPVLTGAPALGRYQLFGNLFATAGGETYRLDRHPTMSRHPATPMDEADLRLHLARQTGRGIGLLDILDYSDNAAGLRERFEQQIAAGNEIVLLDVLNEDHLLQIGGLISGLMSERPVFSASASGLEDALVAYWQSSGRLAAPPAPAGFGAARKIIVVSGSASPATKAQLEWAEANGFASLRLDATLLVDPKLQAAERERAIRTALEQLEAGMSVLLYTVKGNDDPELARTRHRLKELAIDPHQVGELLGRQLGLIMRVLLQRSDARRICVAGGDSSGHVLGQLGVHALEVVAKVATGSPLCLAHSELPALQGLEVSLKAGQVGGADYFGLVRDGTQQSGSDIR